MLDYDGSTDRFAHAWEDTWEEPDYDNPFDPWNCDCDDDFEEG